MKKILFASLMWAGLLGVALAQNVDDDLYYTPKKSKQKTTTTTVKQPVKEVRVSSNPNGQVNVFAPNASTIVVRDRKGNVRDVDEYNRRYTAKENNFALQNDTLYIDEREDSDLRGDWVDGFDGSSDDYEYALRIIRFQNPRYAIPVSSPLYWDIVYARNYVPWDWNVYDDGLYAYIFPTATNRLWWNWRFNSFGWGWNHWGYPYYYDWAWNYRPYWGWGGWYGPYYHTHHWYAYGPGWGWGSIHRPAYHRENYRSPMASRPQIGHDRANRYSSGTRFTGTRVNGNGIHIGDNRVNATRSEATGNGRFSGVQGFRSTSSGVRESGSNSIVRPSTRNNSGNAGSTSVRSTSSYVRPNSVRTTNNTYTRPSSTRSTSEYRTTRSSSSNDNSAYRRTESNSSRSYNSNSTVRSSGFSGGGYSGGAGGGGSRSGGGRSRR